MKSLRMIWSVTRAFSGAGLLGGGILGGGIPLVLLPIMLFFSLFGYKAETGTLLLLVIFGAITGAVVGLAVGVLVGFISSIVTLIAFREQIGSLAHTRAVRVLSVTIAAALMFSGVGVLFNSYDMSGSMILNWRLPAALAAAAYGYWLAGRMSDKREIWNPPDDNASADDYEPLSFHNQW